MKTVPRTPATEAPRPDDIEAADAKDISTYQVGYKKPPLHTRFRKGSRGNGQGGRRKRAETLEDAVANELATVIEVKINGKTKKLTTAEAIIKTMARKALTSDKGALPAAHMLLRTSGARTRDLVDYLLPAMSTDESQRLIDNYMERHGGSGEASQDVASSEEES